MDYIKSWTFCICITLIVSVIFSILKPKGTMGKFYKVIISVFIFISFLYPLTEFNPADFRINFNLESEYENLIENTAKAEIENLVKDVLIKNEIYNSVEEVKDLIFKNLGMVADVKRIGE